MCTTPDQLKSMLSDVKTVTNLHAVTRIPEKNTHANNGTDAMARVRSAGPVSTVSMSSVSYLDHGYGDGDRCNDDDVVFQDVVQCQVAPLHKEEKGHYQED